MEVILEATARVLTREGYRRATTNRIASVAGVSIGSLYRYFPTKDALLVALYERLSAETMAHFVEALAAVAGAPLCVALRAIIRAEFSAHASNEPLQRILSERIPQTDGRPRLDALLERYVALVREQLVARRAEIRDVDPDRAAFMLVHAVHSLSHEALRHRPDYFTDELYLDECVELALRYLQRSAAAFDRPAPIRSATSRAPRRENRARGAHRPASS